jgi:hypothetical protein
MSNIKLRQMPVKAAFFDWAAGHSHCRHRSSHGRGTNAIFFVATLLMQTIEISAPRATGLEGDRGCCPNAPEIR